MHQRQENVVQKRNDVQMYLPHMRQVHFRIIIILDMTMGALLIIIILNNGGMQVGVCLLQILMMVPRLWVLQDLVYFICFLILLDWHMEPLSHI